MAEETWKEVLIMGVVSMEKEILHLITTYNSIDRKIIKRNLKKVYREVGFSNKNIIDDLGMEKNKVDAWTNSRSNNIPTFEDALRLSIKYGFSIRELIEVKEQES